MTISVLAGPFVLKILPPRDCWIYDFDNFFRGGMEDADFVPEDAEDKKRAK